MHNPNRYTTIPGLLIRRAGGGEVELFRPSEATTVLTGFTSLHHRETYGHMEFQYFLGKQFQIWRSRYSMQQKMKFISEGDMPIFELHVPITGDLISWWDGQRQQQLRRLQFEMEYASFIKSETVFEPGQLCETLDMHYSIDFVIQIADKYPVLQQFLDEVEKKGRASLLQEAVRFLSPQMLKVVYHIMHYRGPVEEAEAYYSEQAAMLLEMVLMRAMQLKNNYPQKKDIDASVAVRELIEMHPQHQYTTDELSIYAGIHVTKLHKCFKELHGTTLFDFGQGVRLEHAQRLIRDTRLSLQEIAEQCGYNEHANFTAAFRKRFGIAPQQYRALH